MLPFTLFFCPILFALALQKQSFCHTTTFLLHRKMISKIQLIGNKQVTLFVKLNR